MVETIGSFLLFVLLNCSILTLINVVVVQTRMHYALTQAAQAVSMYSYVLDRVGAAEHLQNMAGKAERTETEINEFKTNLNGVIDGINQLASGNFTGAGLDELGSHGDALLTQVGEGVDALASDPKAMLQYMVSYGLQQGVNWGFGQVAEALVCRYLSNGSRTGEQFLEDFHVVGGRDGLTLSTVSLADRENTRADDSVLLTGAGDVKLIVQYEIEYTFGGLPLPFEKPVLAVTQEAVTRAWLSGKGEGYKP